MMEPTDWVEAAKAARVFDIGQMTIEDRRALARATKRGELIQERVLWPYVTHGTVYKQSWYAPEPSGGAPPERAEES